MGGGSGPWGVRRRGEESGESDMAALVSMCVTYLLCTL